MIIRELVPWGVVGVNFQRLAFTNRLIATLSAFEDHAIGLLLVRHLIERQSRGVIDAMPTQPIDPLATNLLPARKSTP